VPSAGPRARDVSVKALVTGAAGFIASHLAERLVHQGAAVVGLDRFTAFYPRARQEWNLARLAGNDRFRLVDSSIENADLEDLLDGVTHVFHLAAQAGVRESWGRHFRVYTMSNVEATQILLEACVGKPIERLVFASSSSIYGDGFCRHARQARRCLQYWWGFSGRAARRLRADSPRHRPPAARGAHGSAARRDAGHLCRHHACARGAGVYSHRHAGGRASRPVRLDDCCT
jgi:nucleoside-diphosphate-sugar epimerase